MNPIRSLLAGNGKRTAGVNTEAVAEHGAGGARRGEGIPVMVKNGAKFSCKSWVKIGRDMQVFVQKRLIGSGIPGQDISAGGHVITRGWLADRATVRRAKVKIVVNVVGAEVNRLILARRFRAPDLGRSLNDKAGDGGGRVVDGRLGETSERDGGGFVGGGDKIAKGAAEVAGTGVVDSG